MSKRSTTMGVAAVVAISGLLATVTYQAGAAREARARSVTAAVVNLSAVVAGLNQRADDELELGRIGDGIKAEKDGKEAAIQTMQQEYAQIPSGPQKEAKFEELDLAQEIAKNWLAVTMRSYDVERAIRYQDLYRTIKAAAEQMAVDQGYDFVIVDDSKGDVSFDTSVEGVGAETQVLQQIGRRRFLYITADRAVDITKDLIERMNNLYNAGQ